MLALPLTAVMVLHATAVGMAFLTAIGSLPSLLFSLHAGAWVDQHGNRRRTMVVADAGRTLLLASIPAAFFLRILSIPLLIGLWFLVRTFSVFFRVASSTLFVSLVPKNRYVEANSLLHTSRATAFFVGPAIAGFLIQTLTAPVTLLADSLSFLTSAASLALIHPQEPAPAQAHRRDLAGGLRFIRRSTVLRYSFASQATMSLFRTMFMAGLFSTPPGALASLPLSGASFSVPVPWAPWRHPRSPDVLPSGLVSAPPLSGDARC